jgi:peptidoglycan/xylan/chitin deacetylase (PgdA/CDA1 family)
MYHRACAGQHGNDPRMLDRHFAHIAGHHTNVLPGEALVPGAINVCLSFDDGYFDFYATVFPLLKRHNLRALLAVPPAVIREKVDAGPAERLRIGADEAFARPDRGGFCTWSELEEIVGSGHVAIAAHSFTHCRLDTATIDLGVEIDEPQAVLGERLARPIESFVFPYGRYSGRSLQRARRRYRHVFRIGGALNRDWGGRVLYRIDADRMETPRSLFSPARLTGYRARFLWNRLRFR